MADERQPDVEEIRAQDRAHVWHPMVQHRTLEHRDLMVIHRGEGTTVVDAEGREFLDAYSGLWNVNVGYGRREIAEAVYEQMLQLSYYPHLHVNVPATNLASRLAELLPGDLNHLFFSNSGSEANETALKIARQYGRQKHPGENRFKVIARYQGYHGFTFGAMSATGQVARRTGVRTPDAGLSACESSLFLSLREETDLCRRRCGVRERGRRGHCPRGPVNGCGGHCRTDHWRRRRDRPAGRGTCRAFVKSATDTACC